MKHLKLNPVALKKVLDKDFDYPTITMYTGKDRGADGYADDLVRVYTCVPYGQKPLVLYYANHFNDLAELDREVMEWRSNPRKYWDLEIERLCEDEIAQIDFYIEDWKARQKKLKKVLKKMKEKK